MVFGGDAVLVGLYLAGFALSQIIGQRAAALWGAERVCEAIAWAIFVGALMSVWFALCQWQHLEYFGFALTELPPDSRPFANFNQPNSLGTLLVMGLLAVALLRSRERIGDTLTAALLALFGFGIAMTQARAALLELIVVAGILLWRRRELGAVGEWWRLASAGLLLPLSALAWQWGRASAPQTPASRDTAVLLDVGARGPHWASMLDELQRRPWAGYGWNEGAVAQFAVAPDHPAAPGVFDYGHNLMLDLLVWNGMPLGLLLIGALGLWFWQALRHARRPWSVIALCSVAAVFAHAMVEYPLYFSFFLLPVGLWMGALAETVSPRESGVIVVPRWAIPGLAVAVLMAFALVARDYLGVEDDLRAMSFERARIGVTRPRHELSKPVLLSQLAAFTRFARTPERRGMSDADLAAMSDVVQRYPSGPNIVRYAAALAINGRAGDASEQLRRVCKLTRPPGCDAMKSLWGNLGVQTVEIAAVGWPSN